MCNKTSGECRVPSAAKRKHFLGMSLVALAALALSGCAFYTKYQTTTTLLPGNNAYPSREGLKFRIASVNWNTVQSETTPESLNAVAIKNFPSLFSAEAQAWPLQLRVSKTSKMTYDYSAWGLLTLCFVPFPAKMVEQYEVATTVFDPSSQPVSFSMDVKMWTGCSLLGLVPVPSKLFSGSERAKDDVMYSSMVAAIIQQLEREDASNPENLAKVALHAHNRGVRKKATERLDDQALLFKIAMEDEDAKVGKAAVSKLTDQVLLAKIAVADMEADVRRAAIKNLTDQTVLAKIASDDKSADIRSAAVEKLTDQTALARVAVEDKILSIRIAAIGKVTDQALLCQWAEQDPQAAIRQAAMRQVADDRFLVLRLPSEPSAAVRKSMIQTLHGKDALREVGSSAYHRDDRAEALKQLNDRFPDATADVAAVAAAHQALAKQVQALATESDGNKLLGLALGGEFDVLRTDAARRLSDPVVLGQVALRASDREVLKIVLEKLDDKALLNQISAEADDRAMRLAAAQKAGAQSWSEIFDAATDRGATEGMLGDALAAVSLFPTVQADAIDGVQQACLNLIRRGDESRIPEMVDLLENYGDKTLSEDYMNCGQPDLDSAGRSWLTSRGYTISVGDGSNRARWGSGR